MVGPVGGRRREAGQHHWGGWWSLGMGVRRRWWRARAGGCNGGLTVVRHVRVQNSHWISSLVSPLTTFEEKVRVAKSLSGESCKIDSDLISLRANHWPLKLLYLGWLLSGSGVSETGQLSPLGFKPRLLLGWEQDLGKTEQQGQQSRPWCED